MSGTLAFYLYAILPAGTAVPDAPAIVPGAHLELLDCCQVALLASQIPRALFDAADPTNRTADPDWMQARLTAHHAVIAAAAARAACLPMVFGVLFSGLPAIQTWLSPRLAEATRALAAVAGKSEWALELREDEVAHIAWLDEADSGLQRLRYAVAQSGPGIAFLKARQLEAARMAARTRHLGSITADIDQRLGATGLQVASGLTRAGGPAWSVLVPHADRPGERLAAALAPLADCVTPSGLDIHLNGPWPAYSFARIALSGEARHD
jgi:hypothetical protein